MGEPMKVKNGNYSRRKGKRVEYEVRDYFRSLGCIADRVPSSGAAQGFKGDVKVIKPDGSSFLVEVKARAKGFEDIYELAFDKTTTKNFVSAELTGQPVTLSPNFVDLIASPRIYLYSAVGSKRDRVVKKLLGFKRWLGQADYLVIKQDRKPLLFIKYD